MYECMTCFYLIVVSVEKVRVKLSEALINALNAQIISHSDASVSASAHFNATERSIFSYIAV